MTDMLDYIKSFSKTKKVFFALSVAALIYEFAGVPFAVLSLIYDFPPYLNWTDFLPLEIIIYSFDSNGLFAVYEIIFPFIFLIFNIYFLKNRKYNRKIVIANMLFQLINPITFNIFASLPIAFMEFVDGF